MVALPAAMRAPLPAAAPPAGDVRRSRHPVSNAAARSATPPSAAPASAVIAACGCLLLGGAEVWRRETGRGRRSRVGRASAWKTSPERLKIFRVAIAGGTHGNELSGVALIESWARQPAFEGFPSLTVDSFIANPRAVELCRRYVDCDLNRAFSAERLEKGAGGAAQTYEDRRAQELNLRVGPRFDAGAADLCIDLHNTTSNFGDGIIILDTEPANYHWKMRLAAFLQRSRPNARVIIDNGGGPASHAALPMAAKTDLTFEVGPQAHGTLRAEVLRRQRSLVVDALGFIERFNAGTLTEEERSAKPLEVFMLDGPAQYPTGPGGRPSAMIAAPLQGRDFQVLRFGDPAFEDIDTGRVIAWDEEGEECYPCFINEAAYLEKNIAFCKTRRRVINLPPLDCDGTGCKVELPGEQEDQDAA